MKCTGNNLAADGEMRIARLWIEKFFDPILASVPMESKSVLQKRDPTDPFTCL